MSDKALLALAEQHREYWAGTPTAQVIDRLVASNELEQLASFLVESARQMYEQEKA